MPFCLCRWPNGDWSTVLAQNEQDAIIKLDEVSNAEGCPLVQLDDFQVHFHLTDDCYFMLEGLGEVTADAVWEFCYPVLDGMKGEVQEEQDASDDSTLTPAQATRVRDAVRRERERVSAATVEEPETELGRDIKKQMGAPTALIDEVVRQAVRRRSASSRHLASPTERGQARRLDGCRRPELDRLHPLRPS